MTKLLALTGVFEAVAGLGLLARPSQASSLILGLSLESSGAVVIARVAGVALLTLGIACWLARHGQRSREARGLVSAMTIYNFGVLAVLLHGALALGLSGIALWPAVIAHAALGFWCIATLNARP